MQLFPEGSIWRRWDLHIHTPESVLRSNLPTWDEYLKALENAPLEVRAIAATDYGSIAGYERLKHEKENGRLHNLDLILPNVELRISPHTEPGKGINAHLIFDVSDPDHVDIIKAKLSQLTYRFNEQDYGCDHAALKRLGRAFKPSVKSDEEAFVEGLNQFRPSFDKLRTWYQNDEWVSRNSIVVIDNGDDDGASNLKADRGYRAERDQIYRFADAIFSANPSDAAYFLGRKIDTEEDLIERYGGLKPCICGSDTAEPSKLFKPDNDRYCWIKADPTFEGLKQILFEPEERVHIGPRYPEVRDDNRIITRLVVDGDGKPDWLRVDEVPLNAGLVAIIGNKGTGKTALVDLIAYATGAWEPASKTSFISKSGITDIKVSVGWRAGENSTRVIQKQYDQSDQKTRYLSQQFVEDLCANNMVGDKLRSEIESVIFHHLDSEKQLGASGFSALRAKLTDVVRADRQSLWETVQASIAAYVDLVEKIDELPAKKERLRQLTEERAGLQSQLPKLDSAEQEAKANALAEAQNMRAKLEQEISKVAGSEHDLEVTRSKVQRFQRTMDAFFLDISSELRLLGLNEKQIINYKPAFTGDTTQPIEERAQAIKTEIAIKRGLPDDGVEKATLQGLTARIQDLESKLSLDEQVRKRIEALQQRLREVDATVSSLEQEISGINTAKIPQREQRRESIFAGYKQIFSTFEREKEILRQLYAPLSERLSSGADSERRLEFVIDRQIDIAGWTERGESLIDHTKRGPYRQSGSLLHLAEDALLPALQSNDPETAARALSAFFDTFLVDGQTVRGQTKSGVSPRDFLEWAFSLNHIRLSYSIKYNGIGLAQLSPGTKGLVLLMLYREMDENDRRPLLVDQPEENLDNDSIYSTLRGYFRKAKRRRQIILVTHNPNLVVNTDADQVIVAYATESEEREFPALSYSSGSLEHSSEDPDAPGIRQKVCSILEGGVAAFRKRERRYSERHH